MLDGGGGGGGLLYPGGQRVEEVLSRVGGVQGDCLCPVDSVLEVE